MTVGIPRSRSRWQTSDVLGVSGRAVLDGLIAGDDVTGLQLTLMGTADSRDLSVGSADRCPSAVAFADDVGVVACGGGDERQDLVGEGVEDVVGCFAQRGSALAGG